MNMNKETLILSGVAAAALAVGAGVTYGITSLFAKRAKAEKKTTPDSEETAGASAPQPKTDEEIADLKNEKQLRLDAWARFETIYNKTAAVLEFKDSWNNGTGYFNPLTVDVDIPTGVYKSYDPVSKRRLIINKSVGSCIVVFERYNRGAGDVLKCNVEGKPRLAPKDYTPSVEFLEAHFC